MTVTKTRSAGTANNSTVWMRLSGTIQEVLDALADEGFTGLRVPYWTDDDTDAVAIACRQQ